MGGWEGEKDIDWLIRDISYLTCEINIAVNQAQAFSAVKLIVSFKDHIMRLAIVY